MESSPENSSSDEEDMTVSPSGSPRPNAFPSNRTPSNYAERDETNLGINPDNLVVSQSTTNSNIQSFLHSPYTHQNDNGDGGRPNRPSSLPLKNPDWLGATNLDHVYAPHELNPWGKLPPLGQTHATCSHLKEGRDFLFNNKGVPYAIKHPADEVMCNLIEYGILPPDSRKNGGEKSGMKIGKKGPSAIFQSNKYSCVNSFSGGRLCHVPTEIESKDNLRGISRKNHDHHTLMDRIRTNSPRPSARMSGECSNNMDYHPKYGSSKCSLITEVGDSDEDIEEGEKKNEIKTTWSHLLSPSTGSKREPSPFPHFVDRAAVGARTMERFRMRAKAVEELTELKPDPFSERYKPYQRLPRSSKKRKNSNKIGVDSGFLNKEGDKTRMSSSERHKQKIRERRERAKAKRQSGASVRGQKAPKWTSPQKPTD